MTDDMNRDDSTDDDDRRRQMRDLEAAARHGELPDPVHVLRVRSPDQPGKDLYALARWSTAARLVSNAAEIGAGAEVADLGADAMGVARSVGPDDIAPGIIRHIGVAQNGKWLAWYPPVPPEPVPGSPEARGQRN